MLRIERGADISRLCEKEYRRFTLDAYVRKDVRDREVADISRLCEKGR